MSKRSLQLKVEQAARNSREAAPKEHPACEVIAMCKEHGISYELYSQEESDLIAKFPNGQSLRDEYPKSRFKELSDQIERWPVREFDIVDPAKLTDVETGDWGQNEDEGIAVLEGLLNKHKEIGAATVSIQSDILKPILVMNLSKIPKVGIDLFSSTADLYLLDLNDEFIIHFCRHGSWVFGRLP